MMVEIVKVQRQITTAGKNISWLVYDRERKHLQEMPRPDIPENIVKAMGDRYKIYCVASWEDSRGWDLYCSTRSQHW